MKSFREVGALMLEGFGTRGFNENKGLYLGRLPGTLQNIVWGCGVGAVLVGHLKNPYKAAEILAGEIESPIIVIAERVSFDIRLARAIDARHRKGESIIGMAMELSNGTFRDADGAPIIELVSAEAAEKEIVLVTA